jgi:D-3-phosphoglycerate dehydrogenase
MYEVKTFNKIDKKGLDILRTAGCGISDDIENPDGIMVRSAKLHDMVFGDKLVAIARAGIGVDNVPLGRCTEAGVVVFNTPGANAEGVKELAICALMLASRDLVGGIEWVRSIAGHENVAADVEKGKSAYVGPEIMGKTLGIIGLGGIGSKIANAAASLDMNVLGYDPYLSVDAAWSISGGVKHVADVDTIYKNSDYVLIQVHHTEATHHMIDAAAIAKMKDGVRVLNLARAELVDDDAMLAALESGKVARYITDFPNNKTAGAKNVVAFPHLGASTPESEEKCAMMAAEELVDYLRDGTIRNSVNMPALTLRREGVCRLCIIHKESPCIVNNFLDLIGAAGINVEHTASKARGGCAYTIIDTGSPVGDIAEKIAAMADVTRIRVL